MSTPPSYTQALGGGMPASAGAPEINAGGTVTHNGREYSTEEIELARRLWDQMPPELRAEYGNVKP